MKFCQINDSSRVIWAGLLAALLSTSGSVVASATSGPVPAEVADEACIIDAEDADRYAKRRAITVETDMSLPEGCAGTEPVAVITARPPASSPGSGVVAYWPSMQTPVVRFAYGSDMPLIAKLAKTTLRTVFNPMIQSLNKEHGFSFPLLESESRGSINGFNIAALPCHECLVAHDSQTGQFQGFMVFLSEFTGPMSEEQHALFEKYEKLARGCPADCPIASYALSMLEKKEHAAMEALMGDLPMSREVVHIELIEVEAAAQGKGVGKALMKAMVACLVSTGTKQVSLDVMVSNKSAIGFYQKLGFEMDDAWNMGEVVQEAAARGGTRKRAQAAASSVPRWHTTGYLRMIVPLATLRRSLRDVPLPV